MEKITESLKQAARNYLRALESDSDNKSVEASKDRLAEVAMLWAQAEAIAPK